MENNYREISVDNKNEFKIVQKIFTEVYGISLNFQFEDLLKKLNDRGFAICVDLKKCKN